MLKKILKNGWLQIISVILGLLSFLGPKWLSDDIKAAETILHIPIVDLNEVTKEKVSEKVPEKNERELDEFYDLEDIKREEKKLSLSKKNLEIKEKELKVDEKKLKIGEKIKTNK